MQFYRVLTEHTTSHFSRKVLINLGSVAMIQQCGKRVEVTLDWDFTEVFDFRDEERAKQMFAGIWSIDN